MDQIIKTTGSILLLGASLTLYGCFAIEDDINMVCNSNCTIIQGKFTTENGQPIKNVSLELDWNLPGPWLGGKIRKIKKGKTDENGDYKFNFYIEDKELTDGYYSVQFNLPDNSYITFENNKDFQFWGVKKRDTVIVGNYHIPRKGSQITLKIKNRETISGDDRLIISVSYKAGFNQHVSYGVGDLDSDKTSQVTFETAANQYTFIQPSKIKNGQALHLLDSIVIPLGKVQSYEIEF